MVWAGMIMAIVFVVVLFVAMARSQGRSMALEVEETMDPESRSLFAPIQREWREIDETVRTVQGGLAASLGRTALEEATAVRDEMRRALEVRSRVRKVGLARSGTERAIAELEAKLTTITDATERASYEGALAARRLELDHYREVDRILSTIDSNVRQAVAALSEMKTRLRVASSTQDAPEMDGLRETVDRLRTLSSSVDELEQAVGRLNA